MAVRKEDVKLISISELLTKRGFSSSQRGNKTYFLSPFSFERTPSFCVYEHNNTYYDWSSGKYGDVIDLVMEIDNLSFNEAINHLSDGNFTKIERLYEDKDIDRYTFSLSNYTKINEREERDVRIYASSRGITSNFQPSVFYLRDGEVSMRRPSMGFIHVGDDFEVCGIKMRDINPINGQRFSARGKQKYYIIRNYIKGDDKNLFIVESESSANSLLDFLTIIGFGATIVSFGSWNNSPGKIPDFFEGYDRKKLIIDYDGDREKYEERLEKLEHLNLENVEIPVDKGIDINSMLKNGMICKYKKTITQ